MIGRALRQAARLFWFLPGFLLWASFPPMGEKADCLFALAPLIWFARSRPAKASFRLWFLNGLLFWIATLSWMPAIVKNGGPWPLVVLGWGALAAYCALYFGAFGFLSARVWAWTREGGYARRLFAILFAEPVLWCGLELVRSRFLGGFAWNHLGLPLVNANLGSPAAVGGVYALSAVVLLVNGTFAGIAERVLRRAGRWAFVETLVPFALVGGLYVAGSGAVASARARGAKPLTVALVQRNFPCVFSDVAREDPLAAYSNLLAHVSALNPDLVVLPESAMAEFGSIGSPHMRAFAAWAVEYAGADALLTGGARFAGGKEYNSAALYEKGTHAPSLAIYDKVHLVPFGEFIPGDKWITALQRLAPVGSCTPGELKLLGPYGVAICYEDTDSAQMRALAKRGATALVFITNDSWFSRSVEAEQHAWQSLARAVETGLPVVRVGNSGVTGTIAPNGRARLLLREDGRPLVDRPGTMVERVALVSPEDGAGRVRPTPYVALGDIPLFAAFALLMSGMLLVQYWNYHEKRRHLSM